MLCIAIATYFSMHIDISVTSWLVFAILSTIIFLVMQIISGGKFSRFQCIVEISEKNLAVVSIKQCLID